MDVTEGLISRADLARHAGVERPAVSNWQRRKPDFPRTVRLGGAEYLRVAEILDWLDKRTIPADSRFPDEVAGVTYGERVRWSLAGGAPVAAFDSRHADTLCVELLGPVADAFVRVMPLGDYRDLLLAMLYARTMREDAWHRLLLISSISFRDSLRNLLESTRAARAELLTGGLSLAADKDLWKIARLLDRYLGTASDRRRAAAIVFELLVARFAEREGKAGGEHTTPTHIVRAMVDLLGTGISAPRIYDPFCRSGEFLAQAVEKFAAHGGDPSRLTIRGRHPDPRFVQLARMNLALHGAGNAVTIDTDLAIDAPQPAKAFDLVLANPLFNLRLPSLATGPEQDWRYGRPPVHNANLAWLQHVITAMDTGGRAAVLMPAGESSRAGAEAGIRARMVCDGAVDCLIELPPALFPSTSIPVTIWMLKQPTGHCDEVLFIDAGRLGSMASRTLRVLPDKDIDKIVDTYRTWRYQRSEYEPEPGFSAAVHLQELEHNAYSLSARRYVSDPAPTLDGDASGQLEELSSELSKLHGATYAADARVHRLLEGFRA